jgi:hypothetical protein
MPMVFRDGEDTMTVREQYMMVRISKLESALRANPQAYDLDEQGMAEYLHTLAFYETAH